MEHLPARPRGGRTKPAALGRVRPAVRGWEGRSIMVLNGQVMHSEGAYAICCVVHGVHWVRVVRGGACGACGDFGTCGMECMGAWGAWVALGTCEKQRWARSTDEWLV